MFGQRKVSGRKYDGTHSATRNAYGASRLVVHVSESVHRERLTGWVVDQRDLSLYTYPVNTTPFFIKTPLDLPFGLSIYDHTNGTVAAICTARCSMFAAISSVMDAGVWIPRSSGYWRHGGSCGADILARRVPQIRQLWKERGRVKQRGAFELVVRTRGGGLRSRVDSANALADGDEHHSPRGAAAPPSSKCYFTSSSSLLCCRASYVT